MTINDSQLSLQDEKSLRIFGTRYNIEQPGYKVTRDPTICLEYL